MFFARAEMRRGKGKFLLLIAAVALLVYLILVQQAISAALVTSFNGAIKQQSAPVLVYATDALRSPQGSVITPEWQELVETDESVAAVSRIGILSANAEIPGAEDTTTVVLWGAEDPSLGGPATPQEGRAATAAGEAVGSRGDFTLGETVTIPGETIDTEFTVVGLLQDAQLSVQPTLFISYEDYEATARAINPLLPFVLPNLLGVEPAAEPFRTVVALNSASTDIDPLQRDRAAEEFPGVAPVETSFLIILGLFGVVVPLVTGLFFLILTFQKARALTLLRAIGGRSEVLVGWLMFQVVFVVVFGLALGAALYAATTLIEIGTLTLSFSWANVGVWSAILLSLAVLSALASVRRVLNIDPLEATKGNH